MPSEFVEFLHRRKDWLQVVVVQNKWGSYDSALVVDGSYADADDAARNAEELKQQLLDALASGGNVQDVA
ncbi:hypothetical protein ABT340_39390 [Streptosporangium sp. NPDC000239]|uniref:hypothetical protein n=1 Tax=Streptosporangium sp. NPDC000239 TaxID=3154248 RepID=UPI00331C83D6